MPAKILDGRALAALIHADVAKQTKTLGITPGLAAILVGDDPASHLYISLKEKACHEAGIYFEKHLFPKTESEEAIVSHILTLNSRSDIAAILVQLPLPAPLSEDRIIAVILPEKDVDGFHPQNLERIKNNLPSIIPGVALGIMRLIESSGLMPAGKIAALVVNSSIFALPIRFLLEKRGVMVKVIISPGELEEILPSLKRADVVVVAIGRPRFITGSAIKPGAVVIDVGTNRLPDGSLVGDIDFESVREKAGAMTPVPGGVGPMTVAMLLQNVLSLALQANPSV